MKSVCDKYGALFILDEVGSLRSLKIYGMTDNDMWHKVMSGMGRMCISRTSPLFVDKL